MAPGYCSLFSVRGRPVMQRRTEETELFLLIGHYPRHASAQFGVAS